jgi:hypothetical protein
MSVRFTENSNFKRQILEGFKKSVAAYEDQAKEEIKAVKWQHPRETVRANGSVVDSPRDIVDTGNLLRSQQPAQFSGGNTQATVEWSADYALFVHEGTSYPNGTTTPPKRWTESAFAECDRQGKIQDAFNEVLG